MAIQMQKMADASHVALHKMMDKFAPGIADLKKEAAAIMDHAQQKVDDATADAKKAADEAKAKAKKAVKEAEDAATKAKMAADGADRLFAMMDKITIDDEEESGAFFYMG